MEVTPSSGCIAGGGTVELHIKLCPTVAGSFDVKMCICIRECKQLYVRLTGTVEQPKISVKEVRVHHSSDFWTTIVQSAVVPLKINADLTVPFL